MRVATKKQELGHRDESLGEVSRLDRRGKSLDGETSWDEETRVGKKS